MPTYSSPGTDNMRADAMVKSGSLTDSPSGGGKDAGGTENMRAMTQTKSNPGKAMPGSSPRNKWPSGVQSFTEGSV